MRMSTPSTAAATSSALVGVELLPGEEADAVAAACTDANDAATARPHPAAVYVEAPNRLEIDMAAVSEHLGREFGPDDLQVIMGSYFGNIEQWDDERVVLSWSRGM